MYSTTVVEIVRAFDFGDRLCNIPIAFAWTSAFGGYLFVGTVRTITV